MRPAGWSAVEPPPPVPPGAAEPVDAAGDGDPWIAPGAGDELGEGEVEAEGDARGVGFGPGDGLLAGVGVGGLTV